MANLPDAFQRCGVHSLNRTGGEPMDFWGPLETPLEDIPDRDSLCMDTVNFRIRDFMVHNPECRACVYRTACCGGCRAMAVQDHPTDDPEKDLAACEYFRDGWKDRKDAVLRSISERQSERSAHGKHSGRTQKEGA